MDTDRNTIDSCTWQLIPIDADLFRESLGLDLMMFGSGSLRRPEMGPIVSYQNRLEMYPSDEVIYRVTLTGAQLKRALAHILRPDALADGGHGEFYQYSSGLRLVYSTGAQRVTSVLFDGQPIPDDRLFKVGLQAFHFKNIQAFLGLSEEEVLTNQKLRKATTSSQSVVEEYLTNQELVHLPQDPRWIME